VTNGTSTANKIVWHGMVAAMIFVLRRSELPQIAAALDHHDGLRPMYFVPSRNHYGSSVRSVSTVFAGNIAKRIKANPFARKDDSLRISPSSQFDL